MFHFLIDGSAYFIFFLNFEAPTLILAQREVYNTPLQVNLHRLQKILILFILAASLFPIGRDALGFDHESNLVLWELSYLCIMPVYWIVFAFVSLKKIWNTDILRLFPSVYYLITGLAIGKYLNHRELHELYWAMVIPALLLILVTIFCICLRKSNVTTPDQNK